MKNQLLKRRKKRIVEGQIKKIMDAFDFEKVRKTIIFLDMKWKTYPVGGRIPTIEEIKDCAKRLLIDIGNNEYQTLVRSTNGLVARKNPQNGNLILFFSIETCAKLPTIP